MFLLNEFRVSITLKWHGSFDQMRGPVYLTDFLPNYVLLLLSFVFFSLLVSYDLELLCLEAVLFFVFCQLRIKELFYAICTHFFLLVSWEGRGTWDASFGQDPLWSDSGVWFCFSGHTVVWTVWEMHRGFLLCATRWCKKKRNRPGTDWAVCRGLRFFGMRWHKKRKKKWSRTDRAVCLPILTIYVDLLVKRKQN